MGEVGAERFREERGELRPIARGPQPGHAPLSGIPDLGQDLAGDLRRLGHPLLSGRAWKGRALSRCGRRAPLAPFVPDRLQRLSRGGAAGRQPTGAEGD